MENHPEIFTIGTASTSQFSPITGIPVKTIHSTNAILRMPAGALPVEILGGKTGETPQATQALLLVTRAPSREGYIVSVVLQSRARFADMISLVKWVTDSYNW